MSIANLGQLYALSGGKAGALLSFIRNPNQYEELVAPTKEFLSQTSYQRLLKQQDYASSRSDLLKLVDNISVVAEGALHSASSKNDPVRIEQWSNILRIIEALQAERDVAVNSKLLHTYLSLAI